jgi:hypothetical protein
MAALKLPPAGVFFIFITTVLFFDLRAPARENHKIRLP